MPWLLNPILAALSIILFYLLGKELYSHKVGLLASILGAVSVWFLLMSSTMMSHTSSLFFTAFFLLFIFRSIKKPSVFNGLMAGLGLGMSFLIRPYSAVLISIPFLLYYSVHFLKNFKVRLKNVAVFSLIVLISISILLVYNQKTNGHPLRMGYIVRYGEDHGVGFEREGYTGVPHTPLLGAQNIINYFKSLSRDIFGWPISSFFALLPLLWLLLVDPDNRKKDLLLVSGFFTLLVGLYVYWGTNVFVGARMVFETLPIFIILSARGVIELPRLLSSKFKGVDSLHVKKAVVVVLVFFTIYAFAFHMRQWVWPKDTEWYFDGFANNFAGVTPRIHQTLKPKLSDKSVIIFKLLYHPYEYFPYGWWGSGFLYNDPELKGNIIYALDQGDKNKELFNCFPERNFYLYVGTIEKGMLVPLKKEGNEIIYGKSINSDEYDQNSIELIHDPFEFYNVYSSEFRDFLSSLYKNKNISEIDVAYLVEKGTLCEAQKRYKEASLYFEAALQIEKNPEVVSPILNHLVSCYLKAKEYVFAKMINEGISNFKKPRIYGLIPEKGF